MRGSISTDLEPKRKSDAVWRQHLMLASGRTLADHYAALGEPQERVTVMSRAALMLCEAAVQGDLAALKEIGDRIDGKAAPQEEAPTIGTQINVQIVKYSGEAVGADFVGRLRPLAAKEISGTAVDVSGDRRQEGD